MTQTKLVLISNTPQAAEFAQKAGTDCVLVTSEGKNVYVDGVKWTMPNTHFLLRQNLNNPLKKWRALLNQFRMHAGPNGLVLVDFDHGLRELMLVGQKDGNFTYGVFLGDAIERVTVPEYALLSPALCVVAATQDILDGFTKLYVAPFEGRVLSTFDVANCFDLVSDSRATRPVTPTHPSSAPGGPKRALLISYFAGPCRTVGVQRGNYWAEELAAISQGTWDIHLATSIQWPSQTGKVHHVPDLSLAELLEEPQSRYEEPLELDTQNDDALPKGDFVDWADGFIAEEAQDAKNFNTLSYYWRYGLERYFDTLDLHYDAVIISGNPYSVFDFASFAKRKWYSKVILDYRDPYANNPRIKYSDAARAYTQHKERGFNFQADTCVSVNDVCIDFLEARQDTPAVIIPNGYDERVLEGIETTQMSRETINFVHAGSFYHNSPPKAFISCLDPAHHRFHHVGKTAGIEESQLDLPSLQFYGVKPYAETLSILGGGDCGIVYMSETGFETPTKLYEYVAFGLDVLICTHAPLRTGALASVLEDYPGAYWCDNSEDAIQEFLQSYTPSAKAHDIKERYTRRHNTKTLIDVMNKLCAD